MTLLANLTGPRDLRRMNEQQLEELCAEVRATIIQTVGAKGHDGLAVATVLS